MISQARFTTHSEPYTENPAFPIEHIVGTYSGPRVFYTIKGFRGLGFRVYRSVGFTRCGLNRLYWCLTYVRLWQRVVQGFFWYTQGSEGLMSFAGTESFPLRLVLALTINNALDCQWAENAENQMRFRRPGKCNPQSCPARRQMRWSPMH